MEETYYKKILVSSGEVPEQDKLKGEYVFIQKDGSITSLIFPCWMPEGFYEEHFESWLKPVPSPKQEAIEFAEWVSKNYIRLGKDKYVHCYCNPKEMFNMALTMDKLHSIFVKSEKGEK